MLKMSRADIEQRQEQVRESRSLSGPKISLNAQQVEGRKDINMSLDNPLSSLSSNPLLGPVLGPEASAFLGQDKIKFNFEEDISGPRASIDMMWPIYTGGAISAKQQATRAALRQAQAGLDKTKDELDSLLVQKYFGVQLARSVEKLRADLLKQQERDLNRAKRFEKAGMIAKIERLSAQVNRDAAERDFVASQTDRKVAETELAELLREDSVGRLDTPMFVTDDLKTLPYWQDLALSHNPILKALDAQHEQAQMGVQAAKGSYHPQVYLFGHYNMIKHYLTLPEPDWIAGIGVKFTLWDNKDRNASIAAAHSLVNKAQAAHAEVFGEVPGQGASRQVGIAADNHLADLVEPAVEGFEGAAQVAGGSVGHADDMRVAGFEERQYVFLALGDDEPGYLVVGHQQRVDAVDVVGRAGRGGRVLCPELGIFGLCVGVFGRSG